jgi:hypothetical protein
MAAVAIAPRLLSRTGLRGYLRGLTWREIEARMQRGQIPGPLWGMPADDPQARWDRRAVDRALDAASSIPGTLEAEVAALDRALGTG